MCVGGTTTPILMSYEGERKILNISLKGDFCDRPVSPYNSGTEARIEVPQAPEDRAS